MSGLSAGASVAQKRSRRNKQLQGRELRHSCDVDGCTEDRRWELPTGLPNGASHASQSGQTSCQVTHEFLPRRDPGTQDSARSRDRRGLLLRDGPRERLPR